MPESYPNLLHPGIWKQLALGQYHPGRNDHQSTYTPFTPSRIVVHLHFVLHDCSLLLGTEEVERLQSGKKKEHKDQLFGSGDRLVGRGSSTRRGGGRKVRALPRKFVFLGFRRDESGMSREFCRDVPDPWGCSKSLCKKKFVASCSFFVPYSGLHSNSFELCSKWVFSQCPDMGPKVSKRRC